MHYRWNAGEGGLVRVLTFILSPSIHPRCPRATGPRERGEERARGGGGDDRRYDDCAGAKGISRPSRREGVLYCTSWMWLRGDNRVRAFGILSPPSSPPHPSSCSPAALLFPLGFSPFQARVVGFLIVPRLIFPRGMIDICIEYLVKKSFHKK